MRPSKSNFETLEDYVPFGEEWENEMKKFSKQMLIDLLKTKLIYIQRLEQLKDADTNQ